VFDFYLKWGSSVNGFLFLILPVVMIIKTSPRIKQETENKNA